MDAGPPDEPTGASRPPFPVTSLDELVGAHPRTLRRLYETGRPADVVALGERPRGRLLAFEPLQGVFYAARSLVRALARGHLPWEGKVFDLATGEGKNVLLGRPMIRFRFEVAPSELDRLPTLRISYDVGNPWPVRLVRDELREVGGGVTLGPSLLARGEAMRVLLWWGLERRG